jgi:uncharacterized membrane protein YeiH
MNGYEQEVVKVLDLAGAFAFALSGAIAARERNLDVFGIFVLAFITACGGGILRDVCLDTTPSGLRDWRYLAAAVVAASIAMGAYRIAERLKSPVAVFDALGLGLFAVTGAHKSLLFEQNAQVAILLGMISAIGGGVARDVLLDRVAIVLQREIYASAALVGAIFAVGAEYLRLSWLWTTVVPILACSGLRLLSLHFQWNLPTFGRNDAQSR